MERRKKLITSGIVVFSVISLFLTFQLMNLQVPLLNNLLGIGPTGFIIGPNTLSKPHVNSYSKQKTFDLDLTEKRFYYKQHRFNTSQKHILHVFNGPENKTTWVSLPKNSTIHNSSLKLTGLLLINETDLGPNLNLREVAIGDSNSVAGNEIGVSRQAPKNNTRIFSNKKSLLWKRTAGGDAFGIKFGDISGDSKKEVVVGSNTGVVVFNQAGEKILNNSVGLVYSLSISDLNSDQGNEIVAGGGSLYLLNSSLGLLANESSIAGGEIKGVDIGQLDKSTARKEVAIGTIGAESDSKIHYLNISNNNFREYFSMGLPSVNSLDIADLDNDGNNEVVAATYTKLIVLNSTGSSLWNYSLSDRGRSVEVGELINQSSGREILLGVGKDSNNRINIFNSTGGLKGSYAANGMVRGVAIGNISRSTGNNENEMLAVSHTGTLYQLSWNAFPTNTTLKIGGTLTWNYTEGDGRFRTSKIINDSNSNLSNVFQNYIDGASGEIIQVPATTILFSSEYKGRLNISELDISYTYDARSDIDNQTIDYWSRNQDVRTDQAIVSQAKNISFVPPAVDIYIDSIRIDSSADSCGLKNQRYDHFERGGEIYCNISDETLLVNHSTGHSPIYLWHDQLDYSVPVSQLTDQIYNTSGVGNNYWRKNISVVSNASQVFSETFHNITANATLSNVIHGNSFLHVYSGGDSYDITPEVECASGNMDTDLPLNFKACYKDNDNDNITEMFKWRQPNITADTSVNYSLGGMLNLPPKIKNPNVTPKEGLWGSFFNFSAVFDDLENDTVNSTLWVYSNLTNEWDKAAERQEFGNSTIFFNITSDRYWVNGTEFKLEYFDLSEGSQIHSAENLTFDLDINVSRHNVTVDQISGNDSVVYREFENTSQEFVLQFNDTSNLSDWASTESELYVTPAFSNFISVANSTINNSGYSNFTFNPNSSFSPGRQYWRGTLNDTFYRMVNVTNYTVNVKGHLNISYLKPEIGQKLVRNRSSLFEAVLTDEYSQTVEIQNLSGFNCSWYFNNSKIGSSSTNSSGWCNFSWRPDCSFKRLDDYLTNLSVNGSPQFYKIRKNRTSHFVDLVGNSSIDILNPEHLSWFYSGNQIDLNASVNDVCSTCDLNEYSVEWLLGWKQKVNVSLSENEGLNRTDEPVSISGSELKERGVNLTRWKVNQTEVYYQGKRTPVDFYQTKDNHLTESSSLVFLSDINSKEERTYNIFYNNTGSWENESIPYIENGGFESGDFSEWDLVCSNISTYDCSIRRESSSDLQGNYLAYLYANDGFSNLTQNIIGSEADGLIKVRYKAWGNYNDTSFVEIKAGPGKYKFNFSFIKKSEEEASWSSETIYNSSFDFSSPLKIISYDSGDSGDVVGASNFLIDQICLANNTTGDCLNLDTGAPLNKEVKARSNITNELKNQSNYTWTPDESNYRPGRYVLFSNFSGPHYLTDYDHTSIDLFGFSKVSSINISPEKDGECIPGDPMSCFVNSTLDIGCEVEDNRTGWPINDYPVSYYNDSHYLNKSLSNPRGNASYLWINSTSVPGSHNLSCNVSDSPDLYYNASDQNSVSEKVQFVSNYSKGNLTISRDLKQAHNLSKENNETLEFNLTVNNTGNGPLFGIELMVFNKQGITSIYDLDSYLEVEGSCNGTVTFNVSRAADLGNNPVNISLRWSNPSVQFTNKSVNIKTNNNTRLELSERRKNFSVPYGATMVRNLTLDAFGNTKLANVSFNLTGDNASTLKQWLTFDSTGKNLSEFWTNVSRLGSRSIGLNFTIPSDRLLIGNYSGLLTANETELSCNPEEDCQDSVNINLSVTEQDWSLDPGETRNITLSLRGSEKVGNYQLINITNLEPHNLSFNVFHSQDFDNSRPLYDFFNLSLIRQGKTENLTDSSFTLSPDSEQAQIKIDYNISDAVQDDEGIYSLNFSVEPADSSTVPQAIEFERNLEILELGVNITNVTPITEINKSTLLQIYLNVTKGEKRLNDNITYSVWVGDGLCDPEETVNLDNFTQGANWKINCSAPGLSPQEPLKNELIVQGNYTEKSVVLNSSYSRNLTYRDVSAPELNDFELFVNNSSSMLLDNDPNIHQKKENFSKIVAEFNASDNDRIESITLNLTAPRISLTENLTQVRSNIWSFNLTKNETDLTTWPKGDYELNLTIEDVNNLTNTETVLFDVYRPLNFSSNFTSPKGDRFDVNMSFFFPGTDQELHKNKSMSENNGSLIDFTAHSRTYDILTEFRGQEIFLEGVNFTQSAINKYNVTNPDNLTEPFELDFFPNHTSENLGRKPPSFRYPIMGVVLEAYNLSISNATMTFDFSDPYSIAKNAGWDINPDNLRVIYCEDWNYSDKSCEEEMTNEDYFANPPSNFELNFTTSPSTAYIVAEGCYDSGGDLIPNCEGYGGSDTSGGTTSDTSGSSDTGGTTPTEPSEPTAVCGNGVCESGENSDNCPEDCGPGELNITNESEVFSLDSNFGMTRVLLGQNKTKWISLENNINRSLTVDLSTLGGISRFLSFEDDRVRLDPNQEKRKDVEVFVPKSTAPGSYAGILRAVESNYDIEEMESFTIKVRELGAEELSLSVDVLTNKVPQDGNLVLKIEMVHENSNDLIAPNMSYTVKDGKTEKVLKTINETVVFNQSKSYVRKISLKDLDLNPGRNYIEVWASFGDNKAVSKMDTFEIAKPLLATQLGQYLVWAVLVIAAIVGLLYLRRYYLQWKQEKKDEIRYLFPIDYDKIPQKSADSFWVGKIAGSDNKAWFDPEDLKTHVLVAGATGSGKSVAASVFAEEALENDKPVIVFDPTVQWTGFVKSCDDEDLFKYYSVLGMDKRQAKSYKGRIYDMETADRSIDFKEVVNPGEITIFTLNNLSAQGFDRAVRNIIDSIFQEEWEESEELQLLVVFDEVHRLLEKYGGKGGYVALERACREFRKWGIGIIMCSQVLNDFKDAVAGNVLTEVQLNTKSTTDIRKARNKYGEDYAKRITRQGVGVGMLQNPKYNEGNPYFVRFRPTYHNPHRISIDELERYKELNKKLSKIEEKVERLKSQDKETFDSEMELKIAKDKLKEGNFRMVEIYLESLEDTLS